MKDLSRLWTNPIILQRETLGLHESGDVPNVTQSVHDNATP